MTAYMSIKKIALFIQFFLSLSPAMIEEASLVPKKLECFCISFTKDKHNDFLTNRDLFPQRNNHSNFIEKFKNNFNSKHYQSISSFHIIGKYFNKESEKKENNSHNQIKAHLGYRYCNCQPKETFSTMEMVQVKNKQEREVYVINMYGVQLQKASSPDPHLDWNIIEKASNPANKASNHANEVIAEMIYERLNIAFYGITQIAQLEKKEYLVFAPQIGQGIFLTDIKKLSLDENTIRTIYYDKFWQIIEEHVEKLEKKKIKIIFTLFGKTGTTDAENIERHFQTKENWQYIQTKNIYAFNKTGDSMYSEKFTDPYLKENPNTCFIYLHAGNKKNKLNDGGGMEESLKEEIPDLKNVNQLLEMLAKELWQSDENQRHIYFVIIISSIVFFSLILCALFLANNNNNIS